MASCVSLLYSNYWKEHDNRTLETDSNEYSIYQRDAHEDKHYPEKLKTFRNKLIYQEHQKMVVVVVFQQWVQTLKSVGGPIPLLPCVVVINILGFSVEGVHYLVQDSHSWVKYSNTRSKHHPDVKIAPR